MHKQSKRKGKKISNKAQSKILNFSHMGQNTYLKQIMYMMSTI